MLSGDGIDYEVRGTVGCIQETAFTGSVLETTQVSVLRIYVYRAIDLRWTVLFGVRNAHRNVDYLGSSVLCHYNHGGSDVYV